MKRIMSKMTITGAMLLICAAAYGFDGEKVEVGASGGLFITSDATLKEIYGKSLFVPELWLSYNVSEKVCLWAEAGFISKEGIIKEIDEKAELTRLQTGLGLGYKIDFGEKLRLTLGAGAAWYWFKEEAMALSDSGSALGLKVKAGLDYAIGKKLFLRLAPEFSTVSKNKDDLEMKMGGLQLSAGLGYLF
jgi:hypothetical protein